jgi:hypothetical protein
MSSVRLSVSSEGVDVGWEKALVRSGLGVGKSEGELVGFEVRLALVGLRVGFRLEGLDVAGFRVTGFLVGLGAVGLRGITGTGIFVKAAVGIGVGRSAAECVWLLLA